MKSYAYRAAILAASLYAGRATSLPAQAAPTPPTVTVGGVAYAQYLYQLADSANHLNNFDVTRAYLNVIGRFSDGLATRVTADVYRNADGSLGYRLKYAYFGYTPQGGPLTFKLGLIHTALLDWEEALWDYRMQGTMPLERGGYVSSADFGAGVDGHWGGERLHFQAAVVNGEFYSKAPGDKRKDAMARVSLRLLDTDDQSRVGGLRLTAYAQVGAPTTGGTRNRFLGMVSYRSSRLLLAGEGALTRDEAAVTGPPLIPGRVLSGYGIYKLGASHVALLARVDVTDANTNAAGDRTTRVISGASYQVTPNMRLLADWDHLSYEVTPAPAVRATSSQAYLHAQFTF